MANVTVKLKNGTVRRFVYDAIGGAACEGVKYEGGFAIICDRDFLKTSFPAADIESIEDTGMSRGRY